MASGEINHLLELLHEQLISFNLGDANEINLDLLKQVQQESEINLDLLKQVQQELEQLRVIVENPEVMLSGLRLIEQQLEQAIRTSQLREYSELVDKREKLREEIVPLLTKVALPFDKGRQLDDWLRTHWHLSERAAFAAGRGLASGRLDPQALFNPSVSDTELRKMLRGIKSVGPKTADEILEARRHWLASQKEQGLS